MKHCTQDLKSELAAARTTESVLRAELVAMSSAEAELRAELVAMSSAESELRAELVAMSSAGSVLRAKLVVSVTSTVCLVQYSVSARNKSVTHVADLEVAEQALQIAGAEQGADHEARVLSLRGELLQRSRAYDEKSAESLVLAAQEDAVVHASVGLVGWDRARRFLRRDLRHLEVRVL